MGSNCSALQDRVLRQGHPSSVKAFIKSVLSGVLLYKLLQMILALWSKFIPFFLAGRSTSVLENKIEILGKVTGMLKCVADKLCVCRLTKFKISGRLWDFFYTQ